MIWTQEHEARYLRGQRDELLALLALAESANHVVAIENYKSRLRQVTDQLNN